jgi:16S rRNA A1518/A1519 N6-dimethyltransferase RsmA/KsgA/DIM1 with predicted DNA glycosylase/AP lyase activity
MELTPRSPDAGDETLRRALHLASLGFRARRKTLANALAPVGRPRAEWERLLEAMGKGSRARAEELSLADFLALAQENAP